MTKELLIGGLSMVSCSHARFIGDPLCCALRMHASRTSCLCCVEIGGTGSSSRAIKLGDSQ